MGARGGPGFRKLPWMLYLDLFLSIGGSIFMVWLKSCIELLDKILSLAELLSAVSIMYLRFDDLEIMGLI